MHLKYKDTNRWKGKGIKEIYHANSNHKIARIAMLVLDKIELNMKNSIRNDKSFQNDKKMNLSGRHTFINLIHKSKLERYKEKNGQYQYYNSRV